MVGDHTELSGLCSVRYRYQHRSRNPAIYTRYRLLYKSCRMHKQSQLCNTAEETMAQISLPEPFASIERTPLTFGPSPIHSLPRLSKALGGKVNIWAKREDCNSGIAFGGNKTRKLESVARFSYRSLFNPFSLLSNLTFLRFCSLLSQGTSSRTPSRRDVTPSSPLAASNRTTPGR